MRSIVSGGDGLLAFHIANELADKAQIHLLDIDEFHASDYPAGVTWAKCDVRDKVALERELKAADVILHAAAGRPLWKPQDIIELKVDGTRNGRETAGTWGARHVVHINATDGDGGREKSRPAQRGPTPAPATDERGVGGWGQGMTACGWPTWRR